MLHRVKSGHREILRGLPELAGRLPPSARKKRQLLDMAGRGEPRPAHGEQTGLRLYEYLKRDREFAEAIGKARPDWLLGKAERNQRAILAAARGGQPRPGRRTPMAMALNRYTRRKSPAYSPKFDRKIRRARPDWFVSPAAQKKTQLLERAARGLSKPSVTTPIGKSLYRYCYPKSKCHDPLFAKEISELAPHWFRTCSTR